MCAYVVAKNAAISFKISASLFVVSSNPGVSMRMTGFPSRVNLSARLTSVVDDSKPIPTRRLEPLARLINWKQLNELLVIIVRHTLLTDVFPLPVAPMTLTTSKVRFLTGECALGYVRDEDGLYRGWLLLVRTDLV